MNHANKACPKCQSAMRIDYTRIGQYVCMECGHKHLEDIHDESTWLQEWTPAFERKQESA